jgi:hypothetical protein
LFIYRFACPELVALGLHYPYRNLHANNKMKAEMLNSKQIWQILDKQTQIIDNLSIRSALPLALARTL